ncbi:hypothetical protein QBC39DRAFT_144138 [Podospora conica]|nr:hypothetical protein QBC39DRAFT_144138 [Schizothecium conicum]
MPRSVSTARQSAKRSPSSTTSSPVYPLVTRLEQSYGVPNTPRKAQQALSDVRQRPNETFAQFILRAKLADRTDVPHDKYDDLVAYLRKLEGNQFLAAPQYAAQHHGEPMDTSIGHTAIPLPALPRTSASTPRPSREQKQQWQAQGLCRRCGRSGHFANKCHYAVTIGMMIPPPGAPFSGSDSEDDS